MFSRAPKAECHSMGRVATAPICLDPQFAIRNPQSLFGRIATTPICLEKSAISFRSEIRNKPGLIHSDRTRQSKSFNLL
jgi:hypothetical protein